MLPEGFKNQEAREEETKDSFFNQKAQEITRTMDAEAEFSSEEEEQSIVFAQEN